MSVLDRLKDAARKIMPEKHGPGLLSASSMHGHVRIVPFEGETPISLAAMAFHASQIFFTFIAMCCFASVASFQAKWHIGPSGLSGFAIFIAVTNIILSTFLLAVPIVYDKFNKAVRLARALKELRVLLILTCTGVAELLLISFIATISAWTQPGCKDASKDPHSSLGKDFRSQLPGWCRTKKAGTVFFWFGFAFWACSLGLILLDLRSGKISRRSRDPPFSRPSDDPRDDDAESILSRPVNRGRDDRDDDGDEGAIQSPFADSNRYRNPNSPSAAVRTSRSSMDPYGAFSDPAPSGYPPLTPAPRGRASSLSPTRGEDASRPTTSVQSYPNNPYVPPEPRAPPRPPTLGSTVPSAPPSYAPSYPAEPKHISLPALNPSGMSRTMALAYEDTGTTSDSTGYEDPYDRVRTTIGQSAPTGNTRDGLPGYHYR